MTKIRRLTTDDLDELRGLLEYCFGWPHSERNRVRLDHLLRHAASYGAFERGRLASHALSLPFRVGFHGAELACAGIGFVGSYPEFRGMGHVRELMGQILADERARGTHLSYLAPFSYPFYRSFGYEQVFWKDVYECRVDEWPGGARVPGRVVRTDWSGARDAVAAVYGAGADGRPGALLREEWWSEYKFHLRRDYCFAVYYDEDGDPRGYLAYQLAGTALDVFEWKWTSIDAYQALARYLKSHDGWFDLRFETGCPRDVRTGAPAVPLAHKAVPSMMARIVDVEALLRAYPFAGAGDFAFCLRITGDRFAPWNNGVFELRRHDGAVEVVRVGDDAADARDEGGPVTGVAAATAMPEVSLSIQAAVQLLMGARTIDDLVFCGEATCTDAGLAGLLAAILPSGTPELEDYF